MNDAEGRKTGSKRDTKMRGMWRRGVCVRMPGVFLILLAVICSAMFLSSGVSAKADVVVFPEEGDYYIVPEVSEEYALDLSGGDTADGTYFQLWKGNQTDAQIFRIEYVAGGWCRIVHKASGKVVSVENGISEQGAGLCLYPYEETDACLFRLIDCGNGSYMIQNKLSGNRVVDLEDNDASRGSVVRLWDLHDGQSAHWKFLPVPPSVQGLAADNLNRVSFIAQGSSTCKATSAAMAANLIVGSDTYTTASMLDSGVLCRNLNGSTYSGSDGMTYTATYKTDSYVGSLSEVTDAVEAAVAGGVPIVAAVHKNGGTSHHWILIVGKDGSGQYLAVDPGHSAGGTIASQVDTMESMGYEFGLTDYSVPHYGYISFTGG